MGAQKQAVLIRMRQLASAGGRGQAEDLQNSIILQENSKGGHSDAQDIGQALLEC